MQYKKPLLNLPPYCDGCGAVFSVEHALDCRVGSLVGQRHNEVHDAIGDFDFLAWGQVQKEPVICEETVNSCEDTLLVIYKFKKFDKSNKINGLPEAQQTTNKIARSCSQNSPLLTHIKLFK